MNRELNCFAGSISQLLYYRHNQKDPGIVYVEGDTKMIEYGALALANHRICVIDEIGTMDFAKKRLSILLSKGLREIYQQILQL